MSDRTSTPTYSFGPQAEGTALLGLRNGQILVNGVGMVAALICLYAGAAGVGAILTLLIALGMLAVGFLPVHGRTLEQWAPVWVAFIGRRAGGGLRYRSAGPTDGVRGSPD